VFKDVRKTV